MDLAPDFPEQAANTFPFAQSVSLPPFRNARFGGWLPNVRAVVAAY